ncbi:MAG TPA: class I SAM-dependent methyltransferase [Streptosporangiaceae bacterium]|nr:class I SAM-dependent methyltransferase [Streptosporangiaceae bacterium]
MKGFPGRELSLDESRSRFERMYASVLGAPANGLRIRLRRVLPMTRGSYQAILDAGCGAGVFSLELAKQHPEARVTGVELEPELVERANEIARRAGLDNCHFEQGDVTKLDFENAFDLVVSVDNFEHVEDDIAAMRTLLRALRPGGRLVAHTPGYERRWLLLRRRVNFDVPGHVRPGYHADELVAKLTEAGFEVTDHQYTYGPVETFTNNISYLITGADQQRKMVYAAVFPLLLAISWFGQFSRPRWGAGVLVAARRPAEAPTGAQPAGTQHTVA